MSNAQCHPRRKIYGLTGLCKHCYQNQYMANNPEQREKAKIRHKEWYLKNRDAIMKKHPKRMEDRRKTYWMTNCKKYGLAPNQFMYMLGNQDAKCSICLTDFIHISNIAIDHCHMTNVVRGLLCSRCNGGPGLFKDNIQILTKAIQYLQKSV